MSQRPTTTRSSSGRRACARNSHQVRRKNLEWNNETQHRSHPDHPRRQPAAPGRSVRNDARQDGRQAGRREGLCRARPQGRRRQRAGSRSTPVSTSSATARWASRASSPTRRNASTAWRSARATRPSPFSNTRETRDFPEYYQSTVAEQVSARRRRALMVCAGPIKYKGHAQLKADLDNLKSALTGREGDRGVRSGDCAVERRDNDAERILSDRRGLRLRHRRGDARGIQGDRRCRIPAADRRSVPRHLLHHAAGAQHRRVPQMGRAARRGAQHRPRRHPGGPGALPHLLQHQHGTARP